MDKSNQKTKPPFEGPYKKEKSAVAGKHGIGYSTARHLARLGMKKIMQKPVKEETELKHRVSVTVSDPQHSMVSMRKEKMEKKIRVSAKSESDAVELAKHHYKKQGYKIHDANHIGIVEETEQVDEISNELLQRYKQKAGAQVDNPETPSSVKYKRGKGHLLATVKQMKSGKPMPPIQKEDAEMNEAVSVKKANYSWGKMVTVHHGAHTSYPLHPEHQAAIKKLKPGESTSFTDETNRKVTASREGDQVHLSGRGSNKKTTVAHSHFTENSMNTFKQFRQTLEEKKLTPAEMKKREEVAKAIERENPKMPMGMKMAIATKTAKRVAEEVEQAPEDTHYCAKHVRSGLLGDGIVLEAQHAEPDAEGNIEWYMVEFKDGIRKVYTEDLEIMIAEYHGNHKKKKRMTNG